MEASLDKQEEILDFWFGTLQEADSLNHEYAKRWFHKNPEFDQWIETSFAEDIFLAEREEYSEWEDSPRGRLALIILFDQFPRNIFRNDLQTYHFDERAIKIALDGVENGQDRMLYAIERQFFYMPFMHSEEIEMQKLSLKLFQIEIRKTSLRNRSEIWTIPS